MSQVRIEHISGNRAMLGGLHELINALDTLETIVFSVVLTLVSLAALQSALLELSSDADEVPVWNKVIGYLGLGSAGFALFLSNLVMSGGKATSLILLVLGIAGLSTIVRKWRLGPDSRQEKAFSSPPPGAISSLEPNPKLAWCGHCKAHTIAGEVTVSNTNEYGSTYMTYKKKVCGYCRGTMLWNVPSDIRQSTNWTLGCSGVTSLLVIACFIANGFSRSENWLVVGLLLIILLIPVLAFLVWVGYLRIQWCRWLKEQTGESDVQR